MIDRSPLSEGPCTDRTDHLPCLENPAIPGVQDVALRVVAASYPQIARGCPTCNRTQPFVCTGKFRVNANGRLLDIWLLYRCTKCDFTYNLGIVDRVNVSRVDRVLLEGALANDRVLAGRYARDLGILKRKKVALHSGDDWQLIWPGDARLERTRPLRLRLDFDTPLVVRIDQILAQALGVSRSIAAELWNAGIVKQLSPGNAKTLRQWDRCEFFVDAEPATTASGTGDQ